MEELYQILRRYVFKDVLLGSQALTNGHFVSWDHFQGPVAGWLSPHWRALTGSGSLSSLLVESTSSRLSRAGLESQLCHFLAVWL